VPDGGYRWWYLDALSDDGSQALTIIAFIGSVFSPWYASARRRGTAPAEDFCSVNAAFYTPRGKRWAMTERGASALSRSVDHLQIGPSALHWQNGCLTIDLDELTVPLPGRLRGKVTLQAETGVGSARALHPNGRHFWQPLAPLARIDVHMTQPNLRWQGEAYMDSNWGSEPLEAAFSRWHWSRAKMADGSCAVLYNTVNLDGSNTALALCCLRGGMQSLADALYRLAVAQGVKFHLNRRVAAIDIRSGKVSAVRTETGDVFPCDAVICNADPAAVRQGLFGDSVRSALPQGSGERSLSAVTWGLACATGGINLAHHNVFFSPDYRQEFRELLEHQQLPGTPTVYICAQDRGSLMPSRGQPERLLCLVNAPARGDSRPFTDEEIATCATRTFQTLARCGLQLTAETAEQTVTTPNDFARRFPGTGGALYGQASHGWRSSFSRPGARTRIPGLYLAGGGTHPGPGVPMAALSGKLAAQSRLADRASTVRCRTAATAGGTSTP
jgi:phytoene dehydrogenase-like protein